MMLLHPRTLASVFVKILAVFSAAFAFCYSTQAQTAYLWTPGGADIHWSTPGNWSPNGIPGAVDTAVFGANGTSGDPATVDNILTANTTVATLNYTNTGSGNWHVTDIPAGMTLTASNVTIGGLTGNFITDVAMTDGGTFAVNGNLTIGNLPTANQTSVFNLSGLSNFVFSATNGTLNMGQANYSLANVTLAATNNITASTVSLNYSNASSSSSGSLTLGATTNNLNVNNINIAAGRNTSTVSFPAGALSGLRIRGIGGTNGSFANMTLGYHNTSGSGSHASAVLNLNGSPVDLQFGNLILGRSDHQPTATSYGQGIISFDTGALYASKIVMAATVGATANSGQYYAQGIGGINVGASGTLIIGSGGCLLVDQTNNVASSAASVGGLINNGGTIIASNSITKANSSGIGSITNISGTLNMVAGSIGSPAAPIDNFYIASSTIYLAVTNDLTNVVSSAFTPADDGNVINITALPPVFAYPTQFPLITYTSLAASGTIGLGTLPGTFKGYISNDNSSTVWLVVTNGPAVAKTDLWGGAVNNTWDTTTLNWTNAGKAVAYTDGDAVVFDDSAHTASVNLSAAFSPDSLTLNNDSLNYTYSGTGSLSGGTALVKNGNGSLTLTESGGDNFSSGITVNAGTVTLDNPNAVITGGLQISSGATVQIGNNDANGNPPAGGILDNGTLNVARTDNLLINDAISGNGNLNLNGTGTLALGANNGFSGYINVNAGTLALTNSGAISNSLAVTVNGAKLDLSGVSSGVSTMTTLSLNNSTLTLGSSNQVAPLNVTSLAFGGSTNVINISALPSFVAYPATITLIQSVSGVSGPLPGLGTFPSASPAFAGSIQLSPDGLAITLTVTNGPTGGQRQFVVWTGADVPNQKTNWSDAQNWQLPGAPNGENTIFNNNGSQTASAVSTLGGGINAFIPDYVDNIVDSNFTVASLVYSNLTGFYHNTLIKSGKVLSVTNSVFNIGAIDTGSTIQTGIVSISGTNATLSVNNTNANFQVWMGNGSSSSSGNQATLDMSALDTFNATVSRAMIGANTGGVNRPSGVLYLARTNVLTATFQTTTSDSGSTTGNAGLDVADCSSNAGSASSVYLGLVNTISADTINIGRQKATGHLSFNSLYANVAPYPTANFGGYTAGRVSLFEVGNGAGNTGTTTFSADATLSGGFVNMSVDVLNLGRASSGSGSGTTTGSLSFDAGNINANTINIGLQPANGTKIGIGVLNVNSNTIIGAAASVTVNNSINLGFAGGGAGATTTSGTLNINNGTVSANAIEAGTNSISTINLDGGRLSVATTIGTATAPIGTLALTPLNTPDNYKNVLQLAAGPTPSVVVTNLNIDGLDTTTNIINVSSIATVTPPAELPLIEYTSLNFTSGGTYNLGLGTLPAGYTGYLTNDTTLSAIALVVTAAPAAPTTPPTIQKIIISGGNIIISGTNNVGTSGTYHVLTSTNLSLPVANWTVLTNSSFNSDGTFNSTNAIDPTKPRSFYLLQLP